MSMNARCDALRGSAFRGQSLRLSCPTVLRNPRSARLTVENKTLWTLDVDQKWCDLNKEKCSNLQQSLDLSDVISDKLKCLVGETRNCDFMVSCGESGFEAKFESEGDSNPLDSPAKLFMTEVGGNVALAVDGEKIPMGKRVRLYPGSTVKFGDFAQFQVLRNVDAHA